MRSWGWSAAAAIVASVLLAGCAGLAASTGSETDRIVAEIHTQVRTTGLVARAGLPEPTPVPALEVVLDDTHSRLVSTGERVLDLPPDEPVRDDLITLVDAALQLVERVRTALESGDHAELRDSRSRADELAAELDELSERL
ncbi:hypothetical protein L0U85_19425 [Glycomyces sp. L485]|uniref:hypothetical protein n=1 Tax=Glycomyces sp. L485 TaxID=2909235 RepID=UPI001F4B2EBC|nr:hypothetical protein [Glycomyces sp. L485]MCH7233008.1 hypothetical protein [Glycomyces sp. L485]